MSEYDALKRSLPETPVQTWQLQKTFELENHRIHEFELLRDGLRVLGARRRIVYHRDGWVDWVSGVLPEVFEGFPNDLQAIRQWVAGRFPRAGITIEPVYSVEGMLAMAGYDVWVKLPFRHRHFLLDTAARVVKEYRVARVDPGIYGEEPPLIEAVWDFWRILLKPQRTVKGYPINPSKGSPTTVSLSGLSSGTRLISNRFYVQRDQNPANVSAVDVSPTMDFTSVSGFSENPTLYTPACTGASTDCANQGFDAINVYYHLTRYHDRLDGYFADMGVSISFPKPLGVVVNAMRLDFDGDGVTTDEVNNAAYYPLECGTDARGNTMDRCLVFLRPAAANATICKGTAQFFDLAREAVVVVHEYQHFITDQIIRLESGTNSAPNVGDALHEGYSDYFAASFVSEESATTVTHIGAYAFQNCVVLIRDLATLRVYKNNVDQNDPYNDVDPHNSGLSWASGLWALRTEIGREKADKIALRSLFFLSTKPGFIEAVESLVEADKTLYGSANTELIRTIFYQQIRFVGGSVDAFRDPVKGIIETGLRGCAVAQSSGQGSLILLFLWLGLTLGVRWRFS